MRMTGLVSGLVLTVLMDAGAHAAPEPATEFYKVNAQYRGGVKKGFKDLGQGKVIFEPQDAHTFRVRARARVQHPEKKKVYDFKLSRTYTLNGSQIQLQGEDAKQLSPDAQPHEKRVTEVMPFVYIVRTQPLPDLAQGETTKDFTSDNQAYSLVYRRGEGQPEAELIRGQDSLGKFFLRPGTGGGPNSIEKFRVYLPLDKLAVSFVLDREGASQASTGTEPVPRQ